jgi:hypothetical protein
VGAEQGALEQGALEPSDLDGIVVQELRRHRSRRSHSFP